jgi:GntR family histidine utilization transcriptional repressor
MPEAHTWQIIKTSVLRRLSQRHWLPGDTLPSEMEFAREFNCARATVNKALNDLASAGILERKRKSGTRVTINPVRKATMKIPVTRQEIENRGCTYSHALIENSVKRLPPRMTSRFDVPDGVRALHHKALHLADHEPFVYEDRWINIIALPEILEVDFTTCNANEWLVGHAPYSRGELSILSAAASPDEAQQLGIDEDQSILIVERTTWSDTHPITFVRLAYRPGYRLNSTL